MQLIADVGGTMCLAWLVAAQRPWIRPARRCASPQFLEVVAMLPKLVSVSHSPVFVRGDQQVADDQFPGVAQRRHRDDCRKAAPVFAAVGQRQVSCTPRDGVNTSASTLSLDPGNSVGGRLRSNIRNSSRLTRRIQKPIKHASRSEPTRTGCSQNDVAPGSAVISRALRGGGTLTAIENRGGSLYMNP